MPRIEFSGPSAQDSTHIAANPSRLLNCYREPVLSAGRTNFILKSVLGQDPVDDIGTNPVRAMGRGNDKNWLVGDSKLFEIASDGTLTQRGGAITDGANVTIAGNYTDVTFTSGNKYYVWDGSTISEPTTKTFTNVGSHCYVGGYTVISEADGRRFQWSALGDATSLNALHFASADKVDDDILRVVEYRGNLLIMCETSAEVWAITGTGTTAFSFVQSTNTGLKAFNLLVRFDDALFFVGNDGRAYVFGQGVVSTPAVETSLKVDTPTHCFYYEDEGHKMCVIRFSDRPAWVYDLTTGEWHERAETTDFTAWRAIASVRNGSEWLIGNTDGAVLELSRTSRDLDGPLYRRAIGRTLFLGDRKFTVPVVEALARVGEYDIPAVVEEIGLYIDDAVALQIDTNVGLKIGTITADPRQPEISLYESGDGGRTWRGPFTRPLGFMGDYDTRMIWRTRGQFQQYTMRFDWSDPADVSVYADALVTAA